VVKSRADTETGRAAHSLGLQTARPTLKGMAMAEEHVFNRFTEARTAEQRAQQQAQELVDRFLRIADLLREWQEVSFEWYGEDGNLRRPLFPDEKTIHIGHVPTMEQIRDGIEEWKKAIRELQAIESNLTEAQRQVLGLPPR
jgi:hypothetical protein